MVAKVWAEGSSQFQHGSTPIHEVKFKKKCFSVWCGKSWQSCTESWPQPHPAPLGSNGMPTVSQALSTNISGISQRLSWRCRINATILLSAPFQKSDFCVFTNKTLKLFSYFPYFLLGLLKLIALVSVKKNLIPFFISLKTWLPAKKQDHLPLIPTSLRWLPVNFFLITIKA